MKRFSPPLLLIGIGSVLLIAALWAILYPKISASPQKERLPSSLSGLPLNQAIYGPQAIAGVIQLHGVEFPLTDAAIGAYGSQSEITLWVSAASNEASAAEQMTLMTEKINLGRSPFTSPVIQEISNTPIYSLQGLGQQHYYWQRGNLVIWLAADFEIAESVLGETFRFFP